MGGLYTEGVGHIICTALTLLWMSRASSRHLHSQLKELGCRLMF